MEFDINKVYTAVNADELKVGSKIITADCLDALRRYVINGNNEDVDILKYIAPANYMSRFVVESKFQACEESAFTLCYLVSEPEEMKLKWTDLKIGDVIRYKSSGVEYLVAGLDKRSAGCHIYAANTWINDGSLETNWEKVDLVLDEYEGRVEE